MFIKLPNKCVVPEYQITSSQTTFEDIEGLGPEFNVLEYYNINIDSKKIYSYIPERYHKDFVIHLMRVFGTIPPHIDSGITAGINFYVKPGNCRTQFYNPKPGVENRKPFKVNKQEAGFVFTEDELIGTESFVAEDNDVYILDITKIHSVIAPQDFDERITVSFVTGFHDYNAVCEMLRETGNL